MINVNSINKNEKADLLPSFADKPKETGSSFKDILKSVTASYNQDKKSSVIEQTPYNKAKSYSESNNIRADKDNRYKSHSKSYSSKNKSVSKYSENKEPYSTNKPIKDNSKVASKSIDNRENDYKAGAVSNNLNTDNEYKKVDKSSKALSKVEKIGKVNKTGQVNDNEQDNISGENITPLNIISQENFSMKDMLAFLQAVQQGNAAASNDEVVSDEAITLDTVIKQLNLNEEETAVLKNIVDQMGKLSKEDLKGLINSFDLVLESLQSVDQLSDIDILKSIGTALFQDMADSKDLDSAIMVLKEKLESIDLNKLSNINIADENLTEELSKVENPKIDNTILDDENNTKPVTANQQDIVSNIKDNNLHNHADSNIEANLIENKEDINILDKNINTAQNNTTKIENDINISTLENDVENNKVEISNNLLESSVKAEASLNQVDDIMVKTALLIEQVINSDINSANALENESVVSDKALSMKEVVSALKELAVLEESKKSNKNMQIEEIPQQNLAEVETSLDKVLNNTSTEDIDMAFNNNQDKPKDEKVSLRQESQQKLAKQEIVSDTNSKIPAETPAEEVITKEFKVLDASTGESLRAKAEEQIKAESHAKVTKVNFSDMDKSLFNNVDKAFISQNKSGEIFSQSLKDQGNNFNYFLKSEADTIEKMENGLAEAKETAKPYNVKDPKDITRLMKTLQSTVNKGESKLTVVLTPDNLGKLQIQLTESAGKMTAKFISDNETSHKMIMSQSDLLKNQLSEKGITIDNMEFSFSDSTSRQENFSHQSKRSKNSNGKARNGRDNGSDLEVGTQVATNKSNGIYA